jgi:HEXXH motif-containing protein
LDPLGRRHDRSPWQPLSHDHRTLALERLRRAYASLDEVNPNAASFVTNFTRVLLLQENPAEAKFSSYSVGQYIGRSVLSNPHLVDEVLLAEAMVHEAIHALLYMQQHQPPWGLEINEDQYDDSAKVTSPWTGRPLAVTAYLHACFVWYGLLQLWSLAVGSEAFPVRRVRGRIARAALGFEGSGLLENIPFPDRRLVSKDVRLALQELQERVAQSFRASATAVSGT